MRDLSEKKRIIEKRIIRELNLFLTQQGTGLPMSTLAAKYARALNELGGFPEFIEAMRVNGLIRVDFAAHGARTVFAIEPNTQAQATPKVWF